MKKIMENILNKMVQLDHNLTSTEGYPIFNLMIPSSRNSFYISASSVVWYTEDDKLLNEYMQLQNKSGVTIDDKRKFILNHTEQLMEISKIPYLDSSAAKAYNNLLEPEVRQSTFKNGYYGCAFLVQEESILIFFQSRLPEIYQGKNLNDKFEFKNASLKLLESYQGGKIKPDTKITDGAFKKLKEALADCVVVPHLEKHHELRQEIQYLIDFSNNFQVKTTLDYKGAGCVYVTLHVGKDLKEYKLTKSKKEGWVEVDHEETPYKDFLKTLYNDSKILDEKINHFLSNKKI